MFHASHLPGLTHLSTPEERARKENGLLKSFKCKAAGTAQMNGILTGGLTWSLEKGFGLDWCFFNLGGDSQAGSQIGLVGQNQH